MNKKEGRALPDPPAGGSGGADAFLNTHKRFLVHGAAISNPQSKIKHLQW